MTFKIGMKVVCVDAGLDYMGLPTNLIEGLVYTVEDIPLIHGRVALVVAGAPSWHPTKAYRASRFRPAVSPKQQVSFTTGAPRDSDQWDNRRKRVEVVS